MAYKSMRAELTRAWLDVNGKPLHAIRVLVINAGDFLHWKIARQENQWHLFFGFTFQSIFSFRQERTLVAGFGAAVSQLQKPIVLHEHVPIWRSACALSRCN